MELFGKMRHFTSRIFTSNQKERRMRGRIPQSDTNAVAIIIDLVDNGCDISDEAERVR